MCAFFLLLFGPARLSAAPFADQFEFVQPDGTRLQLNGAGDDFHAVFETLDGYTVLFDEKAKAYFYATLSNDGNDLVSTGVLAHKQAPKQMRKKIRENQQAVSDKAFKKRLEWERVMGNSLRWNDLKAANLGQQTTEDGTSIVYAPPASKTKGKKVGLTILIDFPDAKGTITKKQVEDYCNGDSYTEFKNNGSVKSYFKDVSGGALTYTNVVTAYIRMSKDKSYYNNTNKDNGAMGRLLLTDALTILKARTDFKSKILPTFKDLTISYSSIQACNVFFAGADSGAWAKGLWPHSWSLETPFELSSEFYVSRYQMTNMGKELKIGTFCHENGHLLCGFPDLYDYDDDSTGGAGYFCLMNSGNLADPTNPTQVCAYLKLAAGWMSVTNIDGTTADKTLTLVAAPDKGYDTVYRYRRSKVATEYFLLENRQKTGRDAKLPGSGIAIWHIDELGDKDNQSLKANTKHENYECTLVQADNLWHFQKNKNNGDASDLYYKGNKATDYKNKFNDTSAPSALWWDGTKSKLNLSDFSDSGKKMTVTIKK